MGVAYVTSRISQPGYPLHVFAAGDLSHLFSNRRLFRGGLDTFPQAPLTSGSTLTRNLNLPHWKALKGKFAVICLAPLAAGRV